MTENDFKEHRLKILGDIQRLNESMVKFQDILSLLTVEVAQLKVVEKIKIVFFGGLGGTIAAALMTVLMERILR